MSSRLRLASSAAAWNGSVSTPGCTLREQPFALGAEQREILQVQGLGQPVDLHRLAVARRLAEHVERRDRPIQRVVRAQQAPS